MDAPLSRWFLKRRIDYLAFSSLFLASALHGSWLSRLGVVVTATFPDRNKLILEKWEGKKGQKKETGRTEAELAPSMYRWRKR